NTGAICFKFVCSVELQRSPRAATRGWFLLPSWNSRQGGTRGWYRLPLWNSRQVGIRDMLNCVPLVSFGVEGIRIGNPVPLTPDHHIDCGTASLQQGIVGSRWIGRSSGDLVPFGVRYGLDCTPVQSHAVEGWRVRYPPTHTTFHSINFGT